MKHALLIAAGFYTLGLVVFHALFWRIFRWPGRLGGIDPVNRSTIQVLNLSITFIFVIFAIISFVHPDELLGTGLGKTLLVSIALLWVFRAVLQIVFYGHRHPLSLGLFAYFLLGAVLYGFPAIAPG